MSAKEFFSTLESEAEPDKIAGIAHAYVFEVAGEGRWLVDVRDGKIAVTPDWQGAGDVVIATSSEVFDRLVAGTQNPMTAYMTGKLKVSGDMGAAMKLKSLF